MTRRQGILGSLGLAFVPAQQSVAAHTPIGDPNVQIVAAATRASLMAMHGKAVHFAHLMEKGREGLFKWDNRNLSREVAADKQQGIYVAASNDPSASGGAWVRQYTGPVYVTWFGAAGNGKSDDAAAIQAALDCGAAQVIFPPGNYRIRSALNVDGQISIQGQGANLKGARIIPDAAVLEAVQFGKRARFSGFAETLFVARPSYDGATDNIGFALYDVVNATFSGCDSRRSKYPWRFKPGTKQRVAYTTFLNINATFGLYNISADLSAGTGYVNELVFVGGRCTTAPHTISNVHIDQNCNHWRFLAMSLEGTGAQAAFVGGTDAHGTHGIVFDQCRTEGKWANNDIVLEKDTAMLCEVRGWNLYTTVTFGSQDNHLIQTASQNEVNMQASESSVLALRRNGPATDAPLLDLQDQYTPSGTTFGLRYVARRGSGYLMQFLRGTTELVGWTLVDASQAVLNNLGRAIFRRKSSDRSDPVLKIQDEFSSSGTSNLMELRAGRADGTAIGFTNDGSNADQGGIDLVGNAVRFRSAASDHRAAPLQLGDYHFWIDRSGRLRMKNGAPNADTDGAIVGGSV